MPMEKLIELLNEYEISKDHRDYEWKIEKHTKERMCGTYIMGMSGEQYTGAYIDTDEMERIIISKKYMFIEWLVENDKIDTSKANDKNLNGYEIELRIRAVKELVADSEEKTVLYLNLLMLLAIQDEPIRFLCEILK